MLASWKAWLLAGSPAHWIVLSLSAYAVVALILSKVQKVRANEPIALLFNKLNPIVAPFLIKVPVVGPVLVAFLDLWDSPKPAAAPAPVIQPVQPEEKKS